MRFVVVGGSTRTAAIEGISAAGATPALRAHTPSADLEIVEYGQPVRAPVTPVSPSGCPTPAIVTRAVRELLAFETLAVDGGLAADTAAPTVSVGAEQGADIRRADPVPTAPAVFEQARELGTDLPADRLVVGETIPGGTTTALGVMEALGESIAVSSSRAENPLALKRDVVATGLAESELDSGTLAGEPIRAIRRMGDPVLAAVTGLAVGAIDAGTEVTLAGGTQMLAVAACLRHLDVTAPIEIATTAYVARDDSVAIHDATAALDVTLTVTDPEFDRADHSGLQHYSQGVAKEGAGMGGALKLADAADISMAAVRDRVRDCSDRVVNDDGS